MIRQYIIDHGRITLPEVKGLLKSGRRGAISVMEHLDAVKFGIRIKNRRIIS
ncbi:MAG: SelB C-terminal domain-containing protein [Actinomycetota bacterium]